jgi:hypothetical protein
MNASRLKPLPCAEVFARAAVTASSPINHKSFAVKTAPTGLAVTWLFVGEALAAMLCAWHTPPRETYP